MSAREPSHRLLYALFFLSGAASLADEVVWFKSLNLTFGSTTSATATLLAVFMGGLGLGGWVFGRIAPRLRRPALVYAVLEGGVGVFALATPLLFTAIDRGYVFSYRHIGDGPGVLLAARFVLSAAALLPPTVLMGATFPVLARQMEVSAGPGRRSGALYGINTAGAVTGVILCGFFAIPAIGLRATLLASACVSLLAAATAALYRGAPPEPAAASEPPPERFWLAVAFVSGLAAMADEVLWTRILVLHLGSSVYSFSLMLSVYLAGLVGGSLWGAARPAPEPPKRLARAQLALALVLLVQVFAFTLFGRAQIAIGYDLLQARTYLGVLATRAAVTAIYLLPPTFLMGYSFAVLLKIVCRTAESAPRSAGSVYAANTFGGIAGALLAGFAAIPRIGSQNSLFAAGLLASLLAVAILPRDRLAWLAAVGFAGIASLAPRDAVVLSTGVFAKSPGSELLYYDEDVTATVGVKRYANPRPWMSLELNGVNVAGTSPDLIAIQKLQAHLPLALAANPRRIVHIGFGSGGTAYSASLHPVSEIRIVEISPEVLRASDRFFRGVNHGVLRDPRVKATINDGRNFILATPESFDAILSDSIHPRYAGNGSLYTEDYFRLCAARLNPGGVVSMWLPMYSLLPENYRSIVRAFRDVFPNVSIWYAHSVPNSFTVVLATPGRTISFADFRKAIAAPAVRSDLAKIGADDPAEILSYLLLAPDDVTRWVANAQPHTDDLPVVEYQSGRTLFEFGTWSATFADLVAHRSRIESFVTGLTPGDPLADRVLARFRQSAGILRLQSEQVRRMAARQP